MELDELMQKILAILPDASFEDDYLGRLVIYTGMRVEFEPISSGILVPFETEGL